ncbi:MAG: hypothetical protein RBS17_04470 [Coriobacteriia bacterium]|nr:hypothetical protein [Coriobacteriia bacterium]
MKLVSLRRRPRPTPPPFVSRAQESASADPDTRRAAGLPVKVVREQVQCDRPDEPVVTLQPEGLTIEARSAEISSWRMAAVFYGVPWLVAIVVGSVWYLIGGVPEAFFIRVMIWIVFMLLTVALHVIALLTLWGTSYSRCGIETLTIDPVRMTLRRQAGRFPIDMHIPRAIVERAEPVAPRADGRPYPRIEVKAGRSALRFGAGMTSGEAGECLYVLNAFFEREQFARDALTAVVPEATIAPTRAKTPASSKKATTGTSRSTHGREKRAGTVKARVAWWTRRSPRSLDPNDPRRVK